MNTRFIHRDYHVLATTTRTDDGKFLARVAIMALSGDRTRSQRFVDFEAFDTEAQADERAIAGGKEWIDVHIRHERLASDTNFAILS
jgi:hypothetical protein